MRSLIIAVVSVSALAFASGSACRNVSPNLSGNDTGEQITVHSF
jgi:hypothetical protein